MAKVQTFEGKNLSWWDRFERIATSLYPKGLTDSAIWSRAGGDLALIPNNDIGKASWHRALKKLRDGGGGNITVESLLSEMLEDYLGNTKLKALRNRYNRRN